MGTSGAVELELERRESLGLLLLWLRWWWWGIRVAWFTIDSKVPLARGLSQVLYLVREVVEGMGLTGPRGGSKQCMASWPFSHVSSTSS